MSHFFYTLIIYPLIQIIEFAFGFCNKLSGNPGISVIGVSLAVSILCLPLYAVAEKWQQLERDTEKDLEPGVTRIKSSFAGDEQYMILSTYYRQHHYQPIMALRSSFGLLIQIPFFIAAYIFLSTLPILKGKQFLFIRDMGTQDALFHIGIFPVNVLPIAMTVINIIAGAIYTKGFKIREKVQIYGMALIFLVLLYNSPAGLVLYWTMNNIFSLVKNIFYKLRNPLKSFWICTSIVCIPAFFYFLFVSKIKVFYRFSACLFFILIFVMPLITKLFKKLIEGRLSPLVSDSGIRTKIFIFSCIFMFLLSGLVIPSALISSSPIEFSGIGRNPNPLTFIYNTMIQALGLWILWASCIYFLFNNSKIQTFFAATVTSIALCAVVNTFCFALSYGDISTTLSFVSGVNFSSSKFIMLLNVGVLLFIIILSFIFIGIRDGKIFSSVLVIGILSLAGISGANIASISKSYNSYTAQMKNQGAKKESLTPIYHLSKKGKNVVLFMLDRSQNQYIPEILKEAPELADIFSGFTYYPNTVSFGGHTIMGAPGLYGGYEYVPEEMNKRDTVPLNTKNTEALLMLPRILTEQKNFSASVSDPSWSNYNNYTDLSIFQGYPKIQGHQAIGKYTDIWYKEHPDSASIDTTEKQLRHNLILFSLFRESPVCLREVIYKKGSYWSSDQTTQDTKIVMNNYAALDYLKQLTDFTGNDDGSYTCIVNEITHENMFLQAPDYIPVTKVTNYGSSKYAHNDDYHTEIAALKMVGRWIIYLKENGVYDNTKIVIVADHGANDKENCIEKDDALDAAMTGGRYHGRGHYHPLFMFKDIDASGSIKTDNTFMTNVDVPSLLLKGIVSDPVNPFTKKAIPLDTTAFKKNGVTITTCDKHKPEYNGKYTFNIKESEWWTVKNNIFEAKNWSRASVSAK
jgi:YidC/Oxa1 family membrane protein insertase